MQVNAFSVPFKATHGIEPTNRRLPVGAAFRTRLVQSVTKIDYLSVLRNTAKINRKLGMLYLIETIYVE